MNEIVDNQRKTNQQYHTLILLIYLLVLLNLIQLLFNSSLFKHVVEPCIDYFLFPSS